MCIKFLIPAFLLIIAILSILSLRKLNKKCKKLLTGDSLQPGTCEDAKAKGITNQSDCMFKYCTSFDVMPINCPGVMCKNCFSNWN